MSFDDFFQAEMLLWSGVEPVYSLLYLIHFHMYALTFPWEIVEIAILSFDWRFTTSQPIRNSCKPGCGLFKIPKNCGRWDIKLTWIPTLLAAPLPKKYSTSMLIPPAMQATRKQITKMKGGGMIAGYQTLSPSRNLEPFIQWASQFINERVCSSVNRGFKTSRQLPEFHRLLDCMSLATLVITISLWHKCKLSSWGHKIPNRVS